MHGRGVAALCLVVTVAAFVWGYSQFIDGHLVPRAVFVCPVAAVLALGGLVDPRILSAMGPHGKSMPVSLRIIGFTLFGVGAALSLGLFLWAPMASTTPSGATARTASPSSPSTHPAPPPPVGGRSAGSGPHR